MNNLIPVFLKLLKGKKTGLGVLGLGVALVIYLLTGGDLKDILRENTSHSAKAKRTLSLKPNSKYSCRVIRVYDGDTFKCKLESGKEVKVRLLGIDTPESSKNIKGYRDAEKANVNIEKIVELGIKAKNFTKKFLKKNMNVYLETDVQPFDKYGRVLAYVYLPDGKMLNLLLVEEGYANVYTIPPNVKYADILKKAQERAIRLNKGLWAEGMPKR